MKKSASTNSNSTNSIAASVYDQVAQANESSTDIMESETDILSPNFQFTNVRPSEDSMMVLDDNEKSHRVDKQHAAVGQSHMTLRLQKFMQLTEHYGDKTVAADTTASSPAPQTTESSLGEHTFQAKTDWQDSAPSTFVARTTSPPKESVIPANQPAGERIVRPQGPRVRIDPSPLKAKSPHFHADRSTRSPTPHVQPAPLERNEDSLLWKVNSLQWPAVTDSLLLDPSLTIDKIGSNIAKLMTGEQNRVMVTSAKRGEGVTTLATSIARWARGLNRQVLLIDADLEKAELTQTVGLGRELNWLSVVNQPRNVGSVIVQDQNTGMFVMPLLPMTDRSNLPSNVYQALATMLEPISDCFDLVIMDIGPSKQFLNETSRADLVADVGLLVNDSSQTKSDVFGKAKSNLLSAGIAKMIVAENFANNSVRI